jgi:hypothetical protein
MVSSPDHQPCRVNIDQLGDEIPLSMMVTTSEVEEREKNRRVEDEMSKLETQRRVDSHNSSCSYVLCFLTTSSTHSTHDPPN